MIDIRDKKDCVGCNACEQICPVRCISTYRDDQGFEYPKVDLDRCINCRLCEKTCPVLNQSEIRKPLLTMAAKNRDSEIQNMSSSGGVFSALAKSVIAEGGVVFGARFDESWGVVHDFTETIDGLARFQTSKYLQSRIGTTFTKTLEFLKAGRTVLYTGTPCQIAGLKLFVRKEWPNLICAEVVCHGVPSPLVWHDYVQYILNLKGLRFDGIRSINFRNKRNGWKNYEFSMEFSNGDGLYQPSKSNVYMRGFLKDLYLRPSCYSCPAKSGKSNADITLGDFWGLDRSYPRLYEKGLYSLVLQWNEKGRKLLDSICIDQQITTYSDALKYNPALEKCAVIPKKYNNFWVLYKDIRFAAVARILRSMRPSIMKRVFGKLYRIIKK